MSAPVLELTGIAKSFGAVPALVSVDLVVEPGTIVGLLGQNGSGKSTLVKILTGIHRVDAGEIRFHGSVLESPVRHASRRGIVVIHQDLGLHPRLSVLDNVGVGDGYATGKLLPRSRRGELGTFRRLGERLGIDLDPWRLVGELSPAERVFVAVIRALRELEHGGGDGRPLILFDEPTALLPAAESARLIEMMRRLAAGGAGVLFITHRLAELMATCDKAAVIRDGSVVFERPTSEVSHDDYIEAMLGRRMSSYYPEKHPVAGGEPLLRVRGLRGRRLQGLDLDVRPGEIVGVTGLVGMGQEELPMLLCGGAPAAGGAVEVGGRSITTVRDALASGMAMVPGDRRRDGVWTGTTAQENVTLPVLGSLFDRGLLRARRQREQARDLMGRAGVHPPRPDLPISAFSGGNQQKIVFAKWMNTDPRILVLDEPTQGVDAGAKRDLLQWIVSETARGIAVVMASADHEQVAALCHRVLVLREGAIAAVLEGDQVTEEQILKASSGLTSSTGRPEGGTA
ncbi:ribose transport system ATP-binding protein [Actinomadura luteofluorescens]|uniref:Ribose transport system ATP-binding protein n=1 Tax=Actinomadura luteofluorescens TaxID=46163 RepID=A0A7Y9JDA8_9ACTN|nr:sugar ABC transporter ATP-binding protein [Actinomadura luteofluorescens]NYD44710.1 ribose transport system ATP-binding protein [Actinomadura luteofluorescens]